MLRSGNKKLEMPAKKSAKRSAEAAVSPTSSGPSTSPHAAVKKARYDDAHLQQNKHVKSSRVQNTHLRDVWLFKNREAFEPLLPEERNFYTKCTHVDTLKSAKHGTFDTVPRRAIFAQPEQITFGEMKQYQLEGLSWLIYMHDNGLNGILGDEMGLGKTLQTISFLAHLKYEKQIDGPHLIIAPLSVVESWMSELAKWCPSLKAIRFHATEAQRQDLKKVLVGTHYDVVVTSYEMFVAETNFFKTRYSWQYVILDEGHRIKNFETIVATSLRSINAQFRLILTGTPLQNNLLELWSLLHWLYPDLFTEHSKDGFQKGFNASKGEYNQQLVANCRKVLDKIMLRRMKDLVDIMIPDKEEITMFLPIAPLQRAMYKSFLSELDSSTCEQLLGDEQPDEMSTLLAATGGQQKVKGGKTSFYAKIKALMFSLRMCCSHPLLCVKETIPGVSDNPKVIINASAKMLFLDKLLPHLKANGHRVLIFAQYIEILDLLEDYMLDKGWECARLDGGVGRARRKLDMRLFNKPDSNMFCFLLSTRAGGLGITLTAADTVIFYDSDWNPQVDLQAMARAHRIGQKKKVTIYRLCIQETVEERLLSLSQRKMWLTSQVTEDSPKTDETGMSTSDLISAIKFGAQCIFQAADSFDAFVNEDIEVLIERARGAVVGEKAQQAVELSDGSKGLRFFEGQMHSRPTETVKSLVLVDDEKRKRVSRTVNVGGHAVLAQTMFSDEAVPSIVTMLKALGQEDSLKDAAQLRKKDGKKGPKFEHEGNCHACHDGGMIVLCSYCPRAFHPECLGWKKRDLRLKQMFTCPEHKCMECSATASSAGGLILRCRNCPNSYCEDHLPADEEIKFLGESVPELLELGYAPVKQFYYIECDACLIHAKMVAEQGLLLSEEAVEVGVDANGEEFLSSPYVVDAVPQKKKPAAAVVRKAPKSKVEREVESMSESETEDEEEYDEDGDYA